MRLEGRAAALLAGIVVFLALAYSVCLLDVQTLKDLTAEDGPVESLSALYFLIGSVLLLIVYLRSRASEQPLQRFVKGNLACLALAGIFFLASMEEISWGQRLLGVRTPATIAQLNRQGEINIHNLEWFHGHDRAGKRKGFWALLVNLDRLFSVFWFVLCVVIPLANRWSAALRGLFARLKLPIVPISLGILFLLNYLASKALESLGQPHAVVEVKEHNVAFLFLCVALVELHRSGIFGRVLVEPAVVGGS